MSLSNPFCVNVRPLPGKNLLQPGALAPSPGAKQEEGAIRRLEQTANYGLRCHSVYDIVNLQCNLQYIGTGVKRFFKARKIYKRVRGRSREKGSRMGQICSGLICMLKKGGQPLFIPIHCFLSGPLSSPQSWWPYYTDRSRMPAKFLYLIPPFSSQGIPAHSSQKIFPRPPPRFRISW